MAHHHILLPLSIAALTSCTGPNLNIKATDPEEEAVETQRDRVREEFIYLLDHLFGGSPIDSGFGRLPKSMKCDGLCTGENDEARDECSRCEDDEEKSVLNESGVGATEDQLNQVLVEFSSLSCDEIHVKIREKIRKMGGRDGGDLFSAETDCNPLFKEADSCLIYKPNPPRRWELPGEQVVLTSAGQIVKKVVDRQTGRPSYFTDGQNFIRFTIKSTREPYEGVWRYRSKRCD